MSRYRERRHRRRHARRYPEEAEDGGTIYRSRHGMIFGVCRGVAEHYGFSVFWIRVLVIFATCSTAFWGGVGLYIVAAMVMKIEPVLPLESAEDEEFYHSYSSSRTMALHRLKRTFDNLDRRLQRLENTVTTREYDWERRLNS